MATSISAESPKEPLDIHLSAPDLVFVGLNLSWPARPSDFTMNSGLAEQWEAVFPRWEVSERSFSLSEPQHTYSVQLADGSARFLVGSGQGYVHLLAHSEQVLDALRRAKRGPARALVEVQYLQPFADSFDALRVRLAAKLLNDRFLPAAGGELADFALTLDFLMGKDSFQLNAGPVRAHEVPRRVDVPLSKERVPPVAVFFSISSRWDVSKTNGIKLAIQRAVQVAGAIDQEIKK